jgi:hypothetical protein
MITNVQPLGFSFHVYNALPIYFTLICLTFNLYVFLLFVFKFCQYVLILFVFTCYLYTILSFNIWPFGFFLSFVQCSTFMILLSFVFMFKLCYCSYYSSHLFKWLTVYFTFICLTFNLYDFVWICSQVQPLYFSLICVFMKFVS